VDLQQFCVEVSSVCNFGAGLRLRLGRCVYRSGSTLRAKVGEVEEEDWSPKNLGNDFAMGENFKGKFSAFSEKLKVGGTEVGRKMSERIITASGKMKELFQVSTQADKLVEEATAENMEGPDWGKSLELCDFVNTGKVSGQEAVRAIKKRMLVKSTHIQYLALTLLETCVKNCEKMFSEVASEKVLDEMVKIIDDPQTPTENRDKALKLIEAWGESTEELGYLPIFEQTYKVCLNLVLRVEHSSDVFLIVKVRDLEF